MADRPDRTQPPPFDKYARWLRSSFGRVPGVLEGQAYYDLVASSLKVQFEKSAFWLDLQSKLSDYEADYFVDTGMGLMALPHPGNAETKPWVSFLGKTYRRNVLQNRNFPKEPDDGWLLPPKWFEATNDVVRTTFVVRYLDGVHELGRRIEILAKYHELPTESTLQGTPAWYYAGHVVVTMPLMIPTTTWQLQEMEIPIELQITTQVKEVIKELLHRTYELQRMQADDNLEWQWDYDGRAFAANYLGHILHYVEGRIMNVRRMDAEAKET